MNGLPRIIAIIAVLVLLGACSSHSTGIAGANGNAAGCDAAQAAAGKIAPTFTAVENGTKGAADLDAPLVTAATELRGAARSSEGITRDDFNQMAADFDRLRTDLKIATSWNDPGVKADTDAIKADTDAVRADCP